MTPKEARTICIEAHKGQFRKDGVTPYSLHPIAVAEMMSTDDEKVLAYLHDVVEDCDGWTFSRLWDLGLQGNLLNDLKLLTHDKSQAYDLYVFNISCSTQARKVKLADMFHNMSSSPSDKAKSKYLSAIPILMAAI